MSAAPKLKPTHPFLEGQVILSLANGVVDALKMMAEVDANFEKPFAVDRWKTPTEISVYLTMNSDPFKGRLQFHFPKAIAKTIVEKLTGSELAEDSEEILDGVGEVSNMFYGAAKSKLNSIGFNLQMTIPKPCWSKSLPLVVGHSKCMVIPFKVLNELCYVEIIVFE